MTTEDEMTDAVVKAGVDAYYAVDRRVADVSIVVMEVYDAMRRAAEIERREASLKLDPVQYSGAKANTLVPMAVPIMRD